MHSSSLSQSPWHASNGYAQSGSPLLPIISNGLSTSSVGNAGLLEGLSVGLTVGSSVVGLAVGIKFWSKQTSLPRL